MSVHGEQLALYFLDEAKALRFFWGQRGATRHGLNNFLCRASGRSGNCGRDIFCVDSQALDDFLQLLRFERLGPLKIDGHGME